MQEHDLSWVRTEMALAQAAPRSRGGLRRLGAQEPLRDACRFRADHPRLLCASPGSLPHDPELGCSSTRSGPAPTAPSALTVAQGGIQPDGWSGACWAFVNAKFEQFMFGRYPVDERWRVILTASCSSRCWCRC